MNLINTVINLCLSQREDVLRFAHLPGISHAAFYPQGMTLVYLVTFALGAGFWCRYVFQGVTLAVVVICCVNRKFFVLS